MGVIPHRSAEPDMNISSPEFAGICVLTSNDDKLIALVFCPGHSLSADTRGNQPFWWANLFLFADMDQQPCT